MYKDINFLEALKQRLGVGGYDYGKNSKEKKFANRIDKLIKKK